MRRRIRKVYRNIVLIPAMKVAVDPSVEQPPPIFTYIIKTCMCIKFSLHVINYQYVSIDFAFIIRIALQEYEQYSKLPH